MKANGILVGVFLLLYHITEGKPLKRKALGADLIREKREELENDGVSELQKFALDLSSKDDLSRLKERFRSGASQNVENDVEYRRLKRFSIRDDEDKRTSTSTRTSSKDDVVKNSSETDKYKLKRSEEEKTASIQDKDDTLVNRPVEFIRRNPVESEEDKDLHVDHVVGGSWELIHHNPTRYLPGSKSVNTTNNITKHSEYLDDDTTAQYDSDDITQYERAEKSSRKPRVSSRLKDVRSLESDYEIREISKVDTSENNSYDEEDPVVVVVHTRAIKRDGYIGCFIDHYPNRDLKKMFTVNGLTPESCQSVCKDKGHVYAGVQNGYLCHCGDEYGRYGEAGEHECDSACRGDERKRCGGFWRNSVYASDFSDDGVEEIDQQGKNTSSERGARSRIDRVIPLPGLVEEETPVHQEITVYLRSKIPEKHDDFAGEINVVSKKDEQNERQNNPAAVSKLTEIPGPKMKDVASSTNEALINLPQDIVPPKKRTDINMPYLHPQTPQTEFVPSNVVLRTLKPSNRSKRIRQIYRPSESLSYIIRMFESFDEELQKVRYTGFVKLKQNWDDGLLNKRNPKTLILAGNIESAFSETFSKDPYFEKAEVLSLREASIRDNPNTVHKVLVEFALEFKKPAQKKDKELRKLVDKSNRLGDMPVFSDSLDVKEYHIKEEDDSNSNEATSKKKRQDDVDAFLKEVFRQI